MLKFETIWEQIKNDSLLGYDKSKVLFELACETADLVGDFAEIGVYQGRTAKLLDMISKFSHIQRTLHLYDTFQGILNSDKNIYIHQNREFTADFESVKNYLGTENIEYHIGLFPLTFGENNRYFAFVHSDTDTYFGAINSLKAFAPLMISGGIILLDDYQWVCCPGIEKAVKEFLAINDNFNFKSIGNQAIFKKI